VTVVLAGAGWPRDLIAEAGDRRVFLEGSLRDLESLDAPRDLVPWIAEPFGRCLGWDVHADSQQMPAEARHLLHAVVRRVHADGRRLRFTGVPQTSRRAAATFAVEQRAAGVDLIGAQRLATVARALREPVARGTLVGRLRTVEP
jgi:hypothetical protein